MGDIGLAAKEGKDHKEISRQNRPEVDVQSPSNFFNVSLA